MLISLFRLVRTVGICSTPFSDWSGHRRRFQHSDARVSARARFSRQSFVRGHLYYYVTPRLAHIRGTSSTTSHPTLRTHKWHLFYYVTPHTSHTRVAPTCSISAAYAHTTASSKRPSPGATAPAPPDAVSAPRSAASNGSGTAAPDPLAKARTR
eukprot:2526233-Pyramimonas_sp.AAC.2